jgi:hypothetical protein
MPHSLLAPAAKAAGVVRRDVSAAAAAAAAGHSVVASAQILQRQSAAGPQLAAACGRGTGRSRGRGGVMLGGPARAQDSGAIAIMRPAMLACTQAAPAEHPSPTGRPGSRLQGRAAPGRNSQHRRGVAAPWGRHHGSSVLRLTSSPRKYSRRVAWATGGDGCVTPP